MVRNSLKEFSNFPGFPFPCYFRRGEEGGKGKEGGKGERGIEERETGRKRVKGRGRGDEYLKGKEGRDLWGQFSMSAPPTYN